MEIGTVRVRCLVQEHNTVTPGSTRTPRLLYDDGTHTYTPDIHIYNHLLFLSLFLITRKRISSIKACFSVIYSRASEISPLTAVTRLRVKNGGRVYMVKTHENEFGRIWTLMWTCLSEPQAYRDISTFCLLDNLLIFWCCWCKQTVFVTLMQTTNRHA